jgi:methylated-DNA-protein-cysteine methyltransferase related protein
MPLPAGWLPIYRLVRKIPSGRVATYGEIALLAGKPRGARQVGFAMAALRGAKHDVPWHRVLGARPRGQAGISILDPMGAAVQRVLLEREGVSLDPRGRIDLARFGWERVRRLRTAPPTGQRASGRRGSGGASPRRSRSR